MFMTEEKRLQLLPIGPCFGDGGGPWGVGTDTVLIRLLFSLEGKGEGLVNGEEKGVGV